MGYVNGTLYLKIVVLSEGVITSLPGEVAPIYTAFDADIATILAIVQEGHDVWIQSDDMYSYIKVDLVFCETLMQLGNITDAELADLIAKSKQQNELYGTLTSLKAVVDLVMKLMGLPLTGLDSIEALGKAITAILANKEYTSFTDVYNAMIKLRDDLVKADADNFTLINDELTAIKTTTEKAIADLTTSLTDALNTLSEANDAEHQEIRDTITQLDEAVSLKFQGILNSETFKSFKDVEDAIDALHEQDTDNKLITLDGNDEITAETILAFITATGTKFDGIDADITDLQDTKVDKEAGKELYPVTDKAKVEKLIITGEGKKVLFDDGNYKKLRDPFVEDLVLDYEYAEDTIFMYDNKFFRIETDKTTLTDYSQLQELVMSKDISVLQAENEIKEYQSDIYYFKDTLLKYNANLFISLADFKATTFNDDIDELNLKMVGASSKVIVTEYAEGVSYQNKELITVNRVLYRATDDFVSTNVTDDITNELLEVVSDGLTHVMLLDWQPGLELLKGEMVVFNSILYRVKASHVAAASIGIDIESGNIAVVSDGLTRMKLDEWKAGNYYYKTDIFTNGGIIYRATANHTASNITTDRTNGLIEILSDGITRVTIGEWKTGVSYLKDDLFISDKVIYRVLTTHTSGTLTVDLANNMIESLSSKKSRITIEDWTSGIPYAVSEVVLYNKELYRVVTQHISSVFATDLTSGKLEIFSDAMKSATIKPWVTGTEYAQYGVFTYQGFIYRAISKHTAGTFTTDYTNGLIELLGLKTATIQDWAAGSVYSVNELFVFESIIYRVKIAHTASSACSTDYALNRTERIGITDRSYIKPWASGTVYAKNEVLGVGKLIYRATMAHTAGVNAASDLASGKLEVLGTAKDPYIRAWTAGVTYLADDLLYSNAIIYRVKSGYTASAVVATDVTNGYLEPLSYEGITIRTWKPSTEYKQYQILLDGVDVSYRYEVQANYTSGATTIEDDVTNGNLLKYKIGLPNKYEYLDKGGVNQVYAGDIKAAIDKINFMNASNVSLLIDDNNVGIDKTFSSTKIKALIDALPTFDSIFTKEYIESVFAKKEDLPGDISIISNLKDKDGLLYYKDEMIINEVRLVTKTYDFNEIYPVFGKAIDVNNVLLNYGIVNPVNIVCKVTSVDGGIRFGVKRSIDVEYMMDIAIEDGITQVYTIPPFSDLEIWCSNKFELSLAIVAYNLADMVDITSYNNHERNMDDAIGYGTPYYITARFISEAMEFIKGVNQDSLHNKNLDTWLNKDGLYPVSAETLYKHIVNHPATKVLCSQAKIVNVPATPYIANITGTPPTGKVLVQPYEYNTTGKIGVSKLVDDFLTIDNLSGETAYVKSESSKIVPITSLNDTATTTTYDTGKLAVFTDSVSATGVNILSTNIINAITVTRPMSVLASASAGTLRMDTENVSISLEGGYATVTDSNAQSGSLTHLTDNTAIMKFNIYGDTFKIMVKRHSAGSASRVLKIDGIQYPFSDYYSSDVYTSCVIAITGLSPFVEHYVEISGQDLYLDCFDISIGGGIVSYTETPTNKYGGILLKKDNIWYTYNDTDKTVSQITVSNDTPTVDDFKLSDNKVTNCTLSGYTFYVWTACYSVSSFKRSVSYKKDVIRLALPIPFDNKVIEKLNNLTATFELSGNSQIYVGFVDNFSRIVSTKSGVTQVVDIASIADIQSKCQTIDNISTLLTSDMLTYLLSNGSMILYLFITMDLVTDTVSIDNINVNVDEFGKYKLLKEAYYDVELNNGSTDVTIYNKVGSTIVINYY